MAITSLRLHMLVKDRETAVARHAERPDGGARELWGYTTLEAVARAALAALDATWHGHEVVYTVAPTVASDDATSELCRMHYPDVPLRSEITGTQGLYDCRKARRVLGWSHDA